MGTTLTPVSGRNDHRGVGAQPVRRAVVIGALGVVFGDIGTSPIYTFRECLKSSGNAGNEAVLGLLSLVFWALMVTVKIKYVCFVMRAGARVALLGGMKRQILSPRAAPLLSDPVRAVRIESARELAGTDLLALTPRRKRNVRRRWIWTRHSCPPWSILPISAGRAA